MNESKICFVICNSPRSNTHWVLCQFLWSAITRSFLSAVAQGSILVKRMSDRRFVCLSVCHSVYLCVCHSVYLSVCHSLYLSVAHSVCVCHSVSLFVCHPVYLSVTLSVYLNKSTEVHYKPATRPNYLTHPKLKLKPAPNPQKNQLTKNKDQQEHDQD